MGSRDDLLETSQLFGLEGTCAQLRQGFGLLSATIPLSGEFVRRLTGHGTRIRSRSVKAVPIFGSVTFMWVLDFLKVGDICHSRLMICIM